MTDITFWTRSGQKSAKKAASHKIDGFLDTVYFKEEVLREYESNKNYRVGDNGTVLFGYEWGLFRGAFRVAKGVIAVNLGDLGEGFPNKELKHWKKYNINPKFVKIVDRYYDFRNDIRRIVHFMNEANIRFKRYLNKFFPDIEIHKKNLFILDEMEVTLNHIKKIINIDTSLDEFQSRIIFLNIFILESINTKTLTKILDQINPALKYGDNTLSIKKIQDNHLRSKTPSQYIQKLKGVIQPLKSLELLRKFLLFTRIHHDIIVGKKIRTVKNMIYRKKTIYNEIGKNFNALFESNIFGKNFPNKKYFNHYESQIKDYTANLKLLNKFRNSSSAHGFNTKEFTATLSKLKIDEAEEDYSKIYETLISSISRDIDSIYFHLIVPEPPLKEYYETYLSETLKDLRTKNNYQSDFEELESYLYEFLELNVNLKEKLLKIYKLKKSDIKFVSEFCFFISKISNIIKDKSQIYIDIFIEHYSSEPTFSLRCLTSVFGNSERIKTVTYQKTKKIIFESYKKSKYGSDLALHSEYLIRELLKKKKSALNLNLIRDLFKDKKLIFKDTESLITEETQ